MNQELTTVDDAPQHLEAPQAPSPELTVSMATDAANVLAGVIDRQRLYVMLQGKRYVRVEGWQTLAAILGYLPWEVSNELQPDGSYIAVVALRRIVDGKELTRASAECGAPDELDRHGHPTWSERPQYARRSMANTRATSKVCRAAFAYVMSLAGYATTPAEEMEHVIEHAATTKAPPERVSASTHQSAGQQGGPRLITDKMRKRMWAIMKSAGMPEDDLRAILSVAGFESTKNVTFEAYEGIIEAIQQWGRDAESNDAAHQWIEVDEDRG